eukprot:13656346-Heterocapsa_arctica.AAC.1
MEDIANDQTRELEPHRPSDFDLQQDLTHETPANPSIMLDPATWIKQAPGPPSKFTWGRPGDMASTAGGIPNGSTNAAGQLAGGSQSNSKRTNTNPEPQGSHSSGDNSDQAPGGPHQPGGSSSSAGPDHARQLVLLSLFDGIGTAMFAICQMLTN